MALTSPPAEPGQETCAPNQRATIRYRCPPAAAGRVYLAEDLAFIRAWLHNLSTTGIGLVLNKPLHEGLLLTIQLRGTRQQKRFHLEARVVHSTPKDGAWLVGCQFVTPLSAGDLQELL